MADTPQGLPERKEIDGTELIEIWKGDYKGFEDYKEYYSSAKYPNCIVIKNHDILGHIDLYDLQSLPTLILSNTTCESINVNNAKINTIIFDGGSKIEFLSVSDSSIKSLRIIHHSQITNISTEKETEIHNFMISNKSIVEYLYLTHSNIGRLRIDKKSKVSHIDLYRCTNNYVSIQNESEVSLIDSLSSKFSSVTIQQMSQVEKINFSDTQCDSIYLFHSSAGNISLQGSDIKIIYIKNAQTDKISLSGTKANNINCNNNSIISELSIGNSTVTNIQIQNQTHIHLVELEHLAENSKTLNIEGSKIDEVSVALDHPYQIIITSFKKDKETIFSEIYALDLENTIFPKEAFLHISHTYIHDLNFVSFTNLGTIILIGILPLQSFVEFNVSSNKEFVKDEDGRYLFRHVGSDKTIPTIEITNSDLGNTHFIGCNLALFENFEFKDSKMANVFFANTILPHRNSIYTPLEFTNNDYEQRRLALSQFKKIFENQGDMVRATQYRAEEMEVYREQLKDDDSKFLSKEWWNNRGERANLWLNMFSNYYGNNWLKAVGLTLLFNTVLYTFYCWSQGYWFGSDWDKFFLLWAYSFEFLNPLRKADFLEHITKKPPGASAIAIDYISRIIIAYFVYQTITAFRKFGKRSA